MGCSTACSVTVVVAAVVVTRAATHVVQSPLVVLTRVALQNQVVVQPSRHAEQLTLVALQSQAVVHLLVALQQQLAVTHPRAATPVATPVAADAWAAVAC